MIDKLQERITAEDYFELPETNLPRQLLDGVVVEMTAPELAHQDVVLSLGILFRAKSRILGGKTYIAPIDVYLDQDNVPQPDAVWLAPESVCKPEGTKRLKGAPDLIAEVLSPGTARLDRKVKYQLYEQFGVREYWLIDPREQLIEVYQLQGKRFVRVDIYEADETFTSPLLGEINAQEIFAS